MRYLQIIRRVVIHEQSRGRDGGGVLASAKVHIVGLPILRDRRRYDRQGNSSVVFFSRVPDETIRRKRSERKEASLSLRKFRFAQNRSRVVISGIAVSRLTI